MNTIAASELVLNPDNSVYHLKLQPEQIAENIIVVGDPGRVALISNHFNSIEHKVENREIVTHTGTLNGTKISVLSTGMGTDNIDIVLNELDALVNINLSTRTIKDQKKVLNIVRIGTCGALQKEISVNSVVISEFGLGLDGLMNYYAFEQTEEEKELLRQFYSQTDYPLHFAQPYFVKASPSLFNILKSDATIGITATASGFYGPQGRVLRLPLKENKLNEKLNQFSYNNHKIANFEMETSALYGLSRALGHNACTVCVVVANRFSKEFSKDYKPAMNQLIQKVLLKLTQNRS